MLGEDDGQPRSIGSSPPLIDLEYQEIEGQRWGLVMFDSEGQMLRYFSSA